MKISQVAPFAYSAGIASLGVGTEICILLENQEGLISYMSFGSIWGLSTLNILENLNTIKYSLQDKQVLPVKGTHIAGIILLINFFVHSKVFYRLIKETWDAYHWKNIFSNETTANEFVNKRVTAGKSNIAWFLTNKRTNAYPLELAIEEGDLQEIESLLKNGANPNLIDYGSTYRGAPLFCARYNSFLRNFFASDKMLQLFVQHGLQLDRKLFLTIFLQSEGDLFSWFIDNHFKTLIRYCIQARNGPAYLTRHFLAIMYFDVFKDNEEVKEQIESSRTTFLNPPPAIHQRCFALLELNKPKEEFLKLDALQNSCLHWKAVLDPKHLPQALKSLDEKLGEETVNTLLTQKNLAGDTVEQIIIGWGKNDEITNAILARRPATAKSAVA
ncbi:MAG: hypothetical protein SNF33_06025 [Candidatus Algichlamydia australiensis]|nr:hypothetical protein [Chlamydiales bacterium]